MKQYLVTACDETYFDMFGVPWISSVLEISNFKGTAILIAFGFKNKTIIDKLEKNNINIIHTQNILKKRSFIYEKISEIQNQNLGQYAYFDFDGYFNCDINPIFELMEDSIFLRTENNNDGFVCGDNKAWNKFAKFQSLERFCGFDPSIEYFRLANNDIKFISNKWNYIEPARINSDSDVGFLHYRGEIKSLMSSVHNHDFSFQKKYHEINCKWQKEFDKKYQSMSLKMITKDKHEIADTL